jgi:hypothetical protein
MSVRTAGVRGKLLAMLSAIAISAAISTPAPAAQFSFAAFGDTPYNADEEPQLIAMIAEMNHEPLAFTLHVGDFKDARSECSDALFLQRREWFALSRHAFFYTPGDNEWVDCRRARWAPRDPLERLTKLRELFFTRDSSLGQRPLHADRQSARGYPENMRWFVEDVVFATLNIPGPDNHHSAMPEESGRRTRAVLDWMREAFGVARERRLAAVVLATQADLWTGNAGFAEILKTLSAEAQRYDGEVLVVHGDTHWFRFDKPLVDPASGRKVDNVTRLEVYGSPFVNWVQVTVTTGNGRAKFSVVQGSEVAAKQAPAQPSR